MSAVRVTVQILALILSVIWVWSLVSVFNEETPSVALFNSSEDSVGELKVPIKLNIGPTKSSDGSDLESTTTTKLYSHDFKKQTTHPKLPPRYIKDEEIVEPPSLDEVRANMTHYLHTLHANLGALAGPNVDAAEVWDTYLDTTKSLLMKWDAENKHRFPKPRNDNSVFVSLGTYRDPYCPMTLKSLYDKAEHPERLFVGLLQQNCFEDHCRTGVLKGGVVETVGADDDCYKLFCASPEGVRSGACLSGQVRLFNVNESESLGPYMARYLGAKFYRGENYYLQIDSHSEFVNKWDTKLIHMVETAEAQKPVISSYPPDSTFNWKDSIGFRMCDSEFAKAQIEWQIIRLGSSMAFDSQVPKTPRYAPFVAVGFFFAWGGFLHEVPFDPLLPWIFMGEEISMSARLWTAGYDIFSPTTNVLNHYYVRRHYPKFWESVNRFFKKPIHNNLVEIVLKRVKAMLSYPESTPEMINPNSVLYRLEDWSMGTARSYSEYMDMVGINVVDKIVTHNMWCHTGDWPKQAEKYRVKNKNFLK
jgi:[Skp1-protein]-hydroxyproline N-acetylglucosaminyltransferase